MTDTKQTWAIVIVAAMLLGLVLHPLIGGDEDDVSRSDRTELKTCPDYLDVAGPYRSGIDVEYDPAMDWDGDGVSCE